MCMYSEFLFLLDFFGFMNYVTQCHEEDSKRVKYHCEV